MRRVAAVLAALIGVAIAAPALAHDSFIIAPARVSAGAPFTVQVTSSGFFPEPESPIRPARIDRLLAFSGDQPLEAAPSAGDVAMTVALSAPGEDGAIIGLSLSPWDIDLGADEIAHYMDEIGASAGLRTEAQAAAASGPMRETYTKHLKALVCGADCASLAADRPLGLALEFVTDPASPGAFRLLKSGSPLAGQAVFVTTEAGRQPLTTDTHGAVTLPEGLAGPVLLMAVELLPPSEPGGRFTSQWAALTFDAALLAR
jgi:hypothetical protein